MTIGERIKELRIKKGLTQKQLANQTGLSEISIRKYEANERRPKIETIRKISTVLDSYIGYFLSGYYSEYIDEIAEDFSSSGKKIPQSMQIKIDDKYEEMIMNAKTQLSKNLADPNAKAYAKKVIEDISKGLGYSNIRDFLIKNITMSISDLNEKGLRKVLELTQDLLLIKDYVIESEVKTDKSYLEPLAAHERTDIEVTDEMKQHDKDFMMDLKNWKK